MTILSQHATTPRKDTKWRQPCRTVWEEVESGARKMGTMNKMEGRETLLSGILNIANNILV